MNPAIPPLTGRRAFAVLDTQRGWTLGLDGHPILPALHWPGRTFAVESRGPGWLRARAEPGGPGVTLYLPIRAPALLIRIEPDPGLELPRAEGLPDDWTLSTEDGPAWVALSPAGPALRAGSVALGDWPRALGDPAAVPERIGRERKSALQNRTGLNIQGKGSATAWNHRVCEALAGLDGWVTVDPAGHPVAVAGYGPHGAIPATPAERDTLAMALMAAGSPDDVRIWVDRLEVSDAVRRALRLWSGAEDREIGEEGGASPFEHLEPYAGPHPHPASAWDLLQTLHRDLGLRPDAPYARLGAAPRCPPDWEGFTVEHLRVGNSEMALRYLRSGPGHHFEAEQTWGVVPLGLVLEPWLPIPLDSRAQVDGVPATPTFEPEDGGCRVRLQMPLEAPRSLDISPGVPLAE